MPRKVRSRVRHNSSSWITMSSRLVNLSQSPMVHNFRVIHTLVYRGDKIQTIVFTGGFCRTMFRQGRVHQVGFSVFPLISCSLRLASLGNICRANGLGITVEPWWIGFLLVCVSRGSRYQCTRSKSLVSTGTYEDSRAGTVHVRSISVPQARSKYLVSVDSRGSLQSLST